MSTQRKNGKFTKAESEEITKAAALLSPDMVQANISKIQLETNQTLAQVGQKTITAFQDLDLVNKSIEVKKAELERLFGVEKIAKSLEEAEQSYEDRKAEIERELAAQQAQMEQNILDANRKYDRLLADNKETAARIQAQWEFEFSQTKMKEQAIWDESKRRRDTDEKLRVEAIERGFAERDQYLKKSEIEVNDLRARVANIDAEIEKAVSAKVAIITNVLNKDHKHELEIINSKYAAEKVVLDNTITSLKAESTNLQKTIEQLQIQLNAANTKVETIATKALDSAANRQALADLQSLNTSQANGQKRA